MQSIVNDAMINRLVEGKAASVRAIKSFGFSLAWGIDRVVNDQGEAVALEAEASLPAGHQLERFSLWHWSHRAPSDAGVTEWWKDMDRQVSETAPDGKAGLLAERLEDALNASALSGETLPALYTWGRALAHVAPQWERKIMVDRLLNVLEHQGNRLSPLLLQLHQSAHLNAADWSSVSRNRYAADPVSFLYDARSWEALRIIVNAGADPVNRHGVLLLDETVRQVHQDLIGGKPADAEALLLINDLLTVQNNKMLSSTLHTEIRSIEKLLENTGYENAFVAHMRAHRSLTTTGSSPLSLSTRKPRQRS